MAKQDKIQLYSDIQVIKESDVNKEYTNNVEITPTSLHVTNGTFGVAIYPDLISADSSQIRGESLHAASSITIAPSDEGKWTTITNYEEYFGGDMTVNGSITAKDLILEDKTVVTNDNITDYLAVKKVEAEDGFAYQLGTEAQAISKNSFALNGNKAGCRGYYIIGANFDTSTLYLSPYQVTEDFYCIRDGKSWSYSSSGNETDWGTPAEDVMYSTRWLDEQWTRPGDIGYAVGDEVSLIIYGFRTETQKVGSFHYNLLTTITAIENNKVTLALNPLPFTSIIPVSANYKWYSSFMVPTKPDIGAVELMAGATALGGGTIASGEYALAEGGNTLVAGAYGHAEGRDTVAVYAAHAEGATTKALAMTSHAEGEGTVASGVRSHAQGYYTIAASPQQQVWGKFNIEDKDGKYAHIVGGGTHYSADKRKNIHTLDWSGNTWYQGTVRVGGTSYADAKELATVEKVDLAADKATAAQNTANSAQETATAAQSTADTANSKATSALNTANKADEKATAAQSTAAIVYNRPGSITVVNDVSYGDAMNRGAGNIASGTFSFATGYHSEATKNATVAMGNNAKATADYAIAIGQGANSNGTGSVSIGYGNIVESTATSSFVTGWNSTIAGKHSAAIGNYAQTKHENQIALGTYNDATNADDIFMVGNGTSALRKNIFVVKKDGTGYLGDKKILVEGSVVVDTYTKEEIDAKFGDIDTALDSIIAAQESLIGGNA